MNFSSLIIVGAPRSGTNMLRDVLTSIPGFATWPCDEINYIWRYGNAFYESDEFSVNMARPEVCRYIRRKFSWVATKYNAHTVVEKTCANSLRVDFVNKVVPESKYIFIHRDGLDASGSSIKRWTAELDIPYLMKKARFVPLIDLPYYTSRYLWNRLYRLNSKERRVAVWGPKSDNLNQLVKTHQLDELCAIQWKRCVDSSTESFHRMDSSKWIKVAYEDFVCDPKNQLKRIMNFLGIEIKENEIKYAVSGVQMTNVGKGRKTMDDDRIKRLQPLIYDTMTRYGYM